MIVLEKRKGRKHAAIMDPYGNALGFVYGDRVDAFLHELIMCPGSREEDELSDGDF